MYSRPLLIAAIAALALPACKTPYKDSDKKREEQKRDFSKEPSFQAFLGRLRIAVKKKDYAVLQTMMTSDFGYRWDDPPPGDSVFAYWDLNNHWPELDKLLQQPFVPNEDYMVAPPGLTTEPNFAGYRLGIRLVGGSWRFAYFVPPPPVEAVPPAQ